MRVLVIGFGSIGERHAGVLEALGHEVAVVSRRDVAHATRFASIAEAIDRFAPEYAVVANETMMHRAAFGELLKAGFAGATLVEKPLFASAIDAPPARPNVHVAYNLRFHPLLERLREWLAGRPAVAATIYAGQHLSGWRPGRDFRSTYSASRAQGGGVLRDLSHELDYVLWLFGAWRRCAAIGGTGKALGIDAEEHVSVLLECERCPQVSVTLSYLDAAPRRQIVVNTADDTASVDLLSGTFTVGSQAAAETVRVGRDETYRRQHEAILSGKPGSACTYAEGLAVVRLIEAIEKAAADGRWVRA